ncbi:MAG: sensor histidine kinase [Pseudomonadales bacterium]
MQRPISPFRTPGVYTNTSDSVMAYLRPYSVTVLICIAIAIIIWGLSGSGFLETLVISLCIGLSTHTFTMVAIRTTGLSVFLVWLVTIPLGVLIGLLLGAVFTGIAIDKILVGGSPLFALVIALIATYVFYSYYSMNELQEQVREQELDRVRSEKTLVETQLRLLQSQIEPHFLFNTLSNVVSLIAVDPSRAETMLRNLTQFLRASLQRSRSTNTRLQDELELLSDYLAIMQIRMEERLHYDIEADPDVSGVSFPPLILQPLVENAVVHGIEPLETGGVITVRAHRSGDLLKIEVTDTGVGIAQSGRATGLGISNVKERLDRLYEGAAGLTFTDVEPHGLRVSLEIPLKDEVDG